MVENKEEDPDEIGQRPTRVIYVFDRKLELPHSPGNDLSLYAILRSWVKDDSESSKAYPTRVLRPSCPVRVNDQHQSLTNRKAKRTLSDANVSVLACDVESDNRTKTHSTTFPLAVFDAAVKCLCSGITPRTCVGI